MLSAGTSPTPFSLPTHTGETLHSTELLGKPWVVFFYPKANTPGCTTEACDFRDRHSDFLAAGVTVLGVSADSVKRQFNFVEKHSLSATLIADTERTLIESWGVWQEKKNYGRVYMGVVRSTFLFDATGSLVKVWSPVKVKGHAQEVLEAVQALATNGAS